MSLLAFDNALHGNVMRKRFHSDPRIRATEALASRTIPRLDLADHGRAAR
jgi:hypothetical protein